MGEIYSHSKLWLYESCPEAYKIKYIDKTFPDLPVSMSLFLGSIVHESLEWLYEQVKEKRTPSLDELIQDFLTRWHAQFVSTIRLNKGNAEDSMNRGVKFLIDYYQSNAPFSEKTIEIEKKIFFPLDDNGIYFIQGYIDRIVLDENGEYEVHDYKTNEAMKSQNEVDRDRQLAFYHLGLQSIYGKNIDVKLIWHFLAHNKKVESKRTQEQLEKLKLETLELIKKIENETIWPACGKHWCDWCSYKSTIKWKKEGNYDLKRFL
jgi:putative RecB family exonuclease